MSRGLKTRKPLFLVFVPVAFVRRSTIAVRTADRRCDSRQTDKQNRTQNSKLKTNSKLKSSSQLTQLELTHTTISIPRCCPRTELCKIQNTLVIESEVIRTAYIYVNFPACRRYTWFSNSTVRVVILIFKPTCKKELSAATE